MMDLILDCKFKINKEICNNGIKSQVYQVTNTEDSQTICAKTISGYLKDSQYDLRPEFEIQSKLQHKNILKIFSIQESAQLMSQYFGGKEVMYLTMEYCQKGDLFDFIQKQCPNTNKKSLDLPIIKQMCKQIVQSVQHVHNQGYVHRDLKLENILIGNDGLLKLADFGCAKSKSSDLTEVKGTEYYMSPEIIQNSYTNNKQAYDGEKVDVFSLGVIFFSMIFNQHPFRKAQLRDQHYRLIVEERKEKFWDCVRTKLQDFNQEDQENIIELIWGMLQYSPEKRPTLENIYNSKFLQTGDCLTEEELSAYLLKC